LGQNLAVQTRSAGARWPGVCGPVHVV